MCMAEDEERSGHIFMAAVEVPADGKPLLLPPEEAVRWKPDERLWTDYLTPAPGQS